MYFNGEPNIYAVRGWHVRAPTWVNQVKSTLYQGHFVYNSYYLDIYTEYSQPVIIVSARLLGDRPLLVGGKSGQHRTRQLLTATGSDSRESATETKLP